MADIFTKDKRSKIMASITGKETKPEIAIRSFLFKHGFRFRKNLKTLPGKPDIVLPKYRSAIFVHGCFWHEHNCKRAAKPVTNSEFWRSKIQKNVDRDSYVKKELKKLNWRVFIVWGCEVKNQTELEKTLIKLISQLIKINKKSKFET